MVTAGELISELPKGLLKWHDFDREKKALYISAGTEIDDSLFHALEECCPDTEYADAESLDNFIPGKYSYAVVSSAMETAGGKADSVRLVKKIRSLLEEDGKLFVITDNRLAVRYFCGDKDPYTGRNFDGIENYRNADQVTGKPPEGRLYSKAELMRIIEKAGFAYYKFYSVFPDITCPGILLADGYIPNEELNIRLFPRYQSPETVFLDEEGLYMPLMDNGMIHAMANGFLIECPLNGVFSEVDQITLSAERGRENAFCTVVAKDDRVVKKPLYEEGKPKLEELIDNNRYLEAHGIKMVPEKLADSRLVMPHVRGISLAKYLRDTARADKEEFLRQFDSLWELILDSSEHVPYEEMDWERFNPWRDDGKDMNDTDSEQWKRMACGTEEDRENLGVILKRGYIDMVILNGFYIDGEYVFFDQEAYIENLPAKVIMRRNIDLFFHGEPELEKIISRNELEKRYELETCSGIFYAYIHHFLTKLRNDDILKEFHQDHRRRMDAISLNRWRMNFPASDYERIFADIFKNTEKRKIVLFGAGRYAERFVELYQHECQINAIVDNNKARWGQHLLGIKIHPPGFLDGIDESEYKVMICVKNYIPIINQLDRMGLRDYSVYDPEKDYPRKRWLKRETGAPPKKYHVGYVAGVFDLFHIGHLNLFRRAKEQCDYLIVGVVNDERAERIKNKKPFIPFKERLEIVQSCRYVDEAVEIPTNFGNTRDAYGIYHFDCMFTGDDHIGSPHWQGEKRYLEEHGAEMVFFPYTQGTSSTMLQALICRTVEDGNTTIGEEN